MAEPHLWKPFNDLPADTSELTTGELDALRLVWEEQRGLLEKDGALEHFHQGLRREWAIETGIVEGVYTIDRGTTEILIEKGIIADLIPREPGGADSALVAARIQDHQDVLEGLLAFVKGERALSAGYIKELHAALLRHQETYIVIDRFGNLFEKKLEKGAYKQLPNNPTRSNGSIHNYCPPEHVAAEMDRLVALHQEHVSRSVPPEVQAAWLHHVFTQIHPFEDGNGRVARAIATLVFLKAGWFPLVVTRDDRAKYIESLENADQGALAPLVSLFTEIQRRSLLKALQVASEVHPPTTIDEAVSAARAHLVAKGQLPLKEWNRVKNTAEHLLHTTGGLMVVAVDRLQREIAEAKSDYSFSAETGAADELPAASAAAHQLNDLANPNEFHQWATLTLKTEATFKLVVSFYGIGAQFRGVLGASAFLLPEAGAPVAVSDGFFQLNYKEDKARAEKRFRPWLEAAIVRGLSLWRQRL